MVIVCSATWPRAPFGSMRPCCRGPHKLFWLNRLRCYVRADRSLRQTLRAPNLVQHGTDNEKLPPSVRYVSSIINANRLDDYWISDGLKASENHFRYGRSVSLLTETISVPPFVPENRVSISADFHDTMKLNGGFVPSPIEGVGWR